MHEEENAVDLLSEVEARLLACLVEKASTTPDTYPLTLNACVVAANQKTNREPTMQVEQGAAGHALRTLEDKGLVRVEHGARALRYEHTMDAYYHITPRHRAVLAMLMLRGPQTLHELFTRCEKLAEFPSIEDMQDSLDRLCARSPALTLMVPRSGGQREDRYAHLLCGEVRIPEPAVGQANTKSAINDDVLARICELEAQVQILRSELDEIKRSSPSSMPE